MVIRQTLNAMRFSSTKLQFIPRMMVRYTQVKIEQNDARQRLNAFYKWPNLKRKLGFTGEIE